jgi:hypothetical protein
MLLRYGLHVNPKLHYVQTVRIRAVCAMEARPGRLPCSTFEHVVYNCAMRTVGILCLLSVIPALYAQTNPATQSNDTSYVSCGDKAATSRTVGSDIFVSPVGRRRAYVQVTANSVGDQSKPEGHSVMCVNNSRLFVSTQGNTFDLVFLQEASDTETGNSLRMVDWSADGHRLLIELAQWQYESPGLTRTPLIYLAELGTFQQPDLSRSFRSEFGIECSLDVHVAGFTSDNRVVIETEPLSPEVEEVLSLPSCARKKSQWILNVADESIRPLPEGNKVVRNAKVELQSEK